MRVKKGVRDKESNFIFLVLVVVLIIFILIYSRPQKLQRAPTPPTFEDFYGKARCDSGFTIDGVTINAIVSNGTSSKVFGSTIIKSSYSLVLFGGDGNSVRLYIGGNFVGNTTYTPFGIVNKNFTQSTGKTGCPNLSIGPQLEYGNLYASVGPNNPANVYLDNNLMGVTPNTFNVITGTHKINITKSGFYPYVNNYVSVYKDQTTSLNVKLSPSSIIPDTTPPSITNVQVTAINNTSATITWNTNEASDSQVEYGLTTSYTYSTPLDAGTTVSHYVVINGLLEGTTYHFRVKSADYSGNFGSSGDNVFITTDNNPPIISNILVLGVTSSSATINWSTNEPSTTQIEYGLTPAYGQQTTLNANLLISHSQTLSSLSTNKLYYYRVYSRDAVGNLVISGSNTFRTTTGSGSSNPGGSPFVKKQSRSPQQENMFYTIMFVVFILIAIILYAISKKTKKNKTKR